MCSVTAPKLNEEGKKKHAESFLSLLLPSSLQLSVSSLQQGGNKGASAHTHNIRNSEKAKSESPFKSCLFFVWSYFIRVITEHIPISV